MAKNSSRDFRQYNNHWDGKCCIGVPASLPDPNDLVSVLIVFAGVGGGVGATPQQCSGDLLAVLGRPSVVLGVGCKEGKSLCPNPQSPNLFNPGFLFVCVVLNLAERSYNLHFVDEARSEGKGCIWKAAQTN